MSRKNIFGFLTAILIGTLFVTGCSKNSQGGSSEEKVLDEDIIGEEEVKELTEEDLELIEQINSNSVLVYKLYENLGAQSQDPYPVYANNIKVGDGYRTPNEDSDTMMASITIKDSSQNLFGYTKGDSYADLDHMLTKDYGFDIDEEWIDYPGYMIYTKGEVYVCVDYEAKKDRITRILISLDVPKFSNYEVE